MTILPPGPFPIADVNMETWLIRFDENGVCSSPKTREAMLARLAVKKDSPVILFSHGWNNDFSDAVDLYRRFLTNFETIVGQYPIPGSPPIFVGVTWPSVWLPSDAGPQMAGASAQSDDKSAEATLRELLRILPATTNWERLYALLDADGLTPDEAAELARLIAPALQPSDDGGSKEGPPSEKNIMAAMRDLQVAEGGEEDDDLTKIGVVTSDVEEPGTAGLLDFFDPRPALRLASLYIMKDRAGKVGSSGISAMLGDMLKQTSAPIHAVGHSFGCKVMLSAVVFADMIRNLKSLLLLQPAVSHLCFAEAAPGREGPGGYRSVLDRVENPIFLTFSAYDFPLHEIYHLVLLRDADRREKKIAAGPTRAGDPPNSYAALGGYGPRQSSEALIDPIPRPGEDFIFPHSARLVGLDGTLDKRVDSHGGIATPYTAWALRSLMA